MFKVGDKVRIVKKVDFTDWVSPMDDFVGEIGVVTGLIYYSKHNTKACRVSALDDFWWFPDESLELVE